MNALVCIVISGATLWTPQGPVQGKHLVLRDGKIAQIADTAPTGCTAIDGAGGVVTPGLIDAYTNVGLAEVPMEQVTRDDVVAGHEHTKRSGVYASFRVADAYNPRSTLIPIARVAGITSVVAVPSGGLVSGQSAWADLAGATQAAAVKKPRLALHVNMGAADGSKAAHLHTLRTLLAETRRYAGTRAAWEKAQARKPLFGHLELEAVQAALDGTLPVVMRVDRAADIEAALRLAAEYKLRLIIAGGSEAHLMASALAAAKVPVIVNPYEYGPSSFDRVHSSAANPARLAKAGVPLVISAFWGHNVRTLAQVAGNAVRAGLPKADAIKAITSAPADAFGMSGHGRLKAGAVANVVVWSGDPLELSSAPTAVIIGGRRIELESRQSRLRDRYLKGTGLPQPLPLP